jgi:hypothetical protein
MELSCEQFSATGNGGQVVANASAAAPSVIDLHAFEKLLSAMHLLGLQVCDRTSRWADVEASMEYVSILNACENVVTAGYGEVSKISAGFKRLVLKYAAVVSRPTQACYAGDGVHSEIAKIELLTAYEEALSAVPI